MTKMTKRSGLTNLPLTSAEKMALATRRHSGAAYAGCAEQLNYRNGDGTYQCQREPDRFCKNSHECRDYDGPNTGRPFCSRHNVCNVCGIKLPKDRANSQRGGK